MALHQAMAGKEMADEQTHTSRISRLALSTPRHRSERYAISNFPHTALAVLGGRADWVTVLFSYLSNNSITLPLARPYYPTYSYYQSTT